MLKGGSKSMVSAAAQGKQPAARKGRRRPQGDLVMSLRLLMSGDTTTSRPRVNVKKKAIT